MTLCAFNKSSISYVIMRSFIGTNAIGESSEIVEPVMVYTNEKKAIKKLISIAKLPEEKFWIWATPRGK